MKAEEIAKNPLFEGLSRGEVEAVLPFLKCVEADPGTVIIKEGDKDHRLYIFLKGRARVTRRIIAIKGGRATGTTDRSVAEVSPGTAGFFGEMSFLTGEPRSATVEAVEPCKFAVLEREDFKRIAEESPKTALKILNNIATLLCQRIRDLNDKVIKLTTVLSILVEKIKEEAP